MKTQFEKILDFNRAFDVVTKSKPDPDILNKNERLIKYRMSLVEEEFKELQDAVDSKNFTEIIDALTDIQYVVLGFYTALGVNADEAFDIVHESNMSKLCKTEEEAIETVNFYKRNPELGYDSPDYKTSNDGMYYIVYNASTSKILKSINYTPANFKNLISNSSKKTVTFSDEKTFDNVKNSFISFFDKII